MSLTSSLRGYDPSVVDRYDTERIDLEEVFANAVRSVHHVGSTAIPGIWAKPEIDILVILASTDDIDRYASSMESLGYRVRGDIDGDGRFYYSKDTHGVRTHKVHVCPVGLASAWELVAFRDFLLDHRDVAVQYSELKVRLEAENATGMREYLDGKDPFIQNVLDKARQAGYAAEMLDK